MGDALVLGEVGAQVLLSPADAAVVDDLSMAKSVAAEVMEVALAHLRVSPLRTKTSSTRLDALASTGFGLSQSKVTKLIQSGHVLVDWRPQTCASYSLRAGQLVFLRGSGSLLVGDASATTKGRANVSLTRTW